MTYQDEITNEIMNENLEHALSMMFKENTGCSILDSGGIGGRRFEQLANVDLDSVPESKVTLWEDGDVHVSINLYHFLRTHLKITPISKKLETDLWDYINRTTDDYDDVIEEWITDLKEDGYIPRESDSPEKDTIHFRLCGHGYTYNYEDLLDGDFKFYVLEDKESEDHYIIIQTHNGCDARGGLSSPHVFGFDECYGDGYTEMLHDMSEYNITIKSVAKDEDDPCYYTDDNGAHWYEYGISINKYLTNKEFGKLIIKEVLGNDMDYYVEHMELENQLESMHGWRQSNIIIEGYSTSYCPFIIKK